ncbi:MAG: aldo/keto reductase [Ignavibacteriae bacterium]|nr:aldo/keto reductase [Ignavibacteriota bacterium]MCB9244634.1 aldo/keto reductase [Ignavibacteriales bacterium]
MKTRKLGHSDIEVSAIGLGTMGMSEFYGQTNEEESIKTIHTALDNGVNFFDTSDMYGIGHNETLLGKAIKDRRDEAVIATKFGVLRNAETRGFAGVSGKPEYVKQSCEGSLKRLGIDTIDLYYQHRIDLEVPVEETIGAMAELVKEGKVRCLGISEASADTLRRANSVHPISALQSEYSLWTREIEDDILPTARELGVSLVAYSPLGRGFLTGKYKKIEDFDENDYRRSSPRFMGDNFQKNLDLVAKIEEVANELKCTPSQVALAWVLAQGDDIIPIPGTKRVKYLLENIAAVDIDLMPDEMESIDNIANEVMGTRYPEASMKTVSR